MTNRTAIGEQDAFLLDSALPDQAFAESDSGREPQFAGLRVT